MTEEQLKNLLFKISVMAVHSISEGSTDPISVQEAIEHNSTTRPILFSTQIMNVKNISNSEKEITFAFSPDYLIENQSLVLQGGLNELAWIYKLPAYDYGNEEILMEDKEGTISMRSEEGVVEWLIRGNIEITSINKATYSIELETLYHSVIQTNSN